jgi:hypothetical protein
MNVFSELVLEDYIPNYTGNMGLAMMVMNKLGISLIPQSSEKGFSWLAMDVKSVSYVGNITIKEKNKRNKNNVIVWLCKCDCGNYKEIIGGILNDGFTRSCGCMWGNPEDLGGQVFDDLTVINRDESNKKNWVCRCICGEVTSKSISYLRNKKHHSCGCYEKNKKLEKFNIENLIFDKLIVVKKENYEEFPNAKTKWVCRCECGNEIIASFSSLTKRGLDSCGCDRKEDLIGKKFGKLIVREYYGKGKSDQNLWICDCSCGREITTSGDCLRSGGTKSCGCLNESYVCLELKKYCSEKYNAIPEYKVFKNPETGYYLPFDIYIPKYKIFLEVHGSQHFSNRHFWDRDDAKFEKSQYRDTIKQEYAEVNGIYLLIDLRKINKIEKAIEFVDNFILEIAKTYE